MSKTEAERKLERRTRRDLLQERDSSLAVRDAYVKLCAAILIQALRDTQSGNPEQKFDAVAWLAGQDAMALANVLGLGDVFLELTRGRASLPGRIIRGSRRQ